MIMDGLVKYLREEKYYEDLYDLWAVENILDFKKSWKKSCCIGTGKKRLKNG